MKRIKAVTERSGTVILVLLLPVIICSIACEQVNQSNGNRREP